MASEPERFYITGGTLPANSESYIVRQADTDLLQGLEAGEFCYVLNTRQIGKSSLMVRAAQSLRAQGHLVAILDLTAIGQNVTIEEWYDGLLTLLAEQVRMRDALEDFWLDNDRLGPLQRWMEAIRCVILEARPERLFVFVDEIDAVRSLPFSTDEFFVAIRECYNRRVQDTAFDRLTFCLLGVAAPTDLIADTRLSPFNVGRRITLNDFTVREAQPLTQGLQAAFRSSALPHPPDVAPRPGVSVPPSRLSAASPSAGALLPSALTSSRAHRLLRRVLYWTNGHPYLTQRLCHALAQTPGLPQKRDVDKTCRALFLAQEAQNTDDNMAFVRASLLRHAADAAALLDLYRQIRFGRKISDDRTNPVCTALRLSGIVRVVNGNLRVRNRIYAHVFDLAWIIENMPGAELRRQRAAYKRGMVRAATVLGSLSALIAALLFMAIVNARHARDAEKNASHLLYISDMNLLQREWEAGNTAHALELLRETRDSGEKGLEWDYWNRLYLHSLRTLEQSVGTSSVAFSPDQQQAAGMDAAGHIKIWDTASGHLLRTIDLGEKDTYGLTYTPDGNLLAAEQYKVEIRSGATGELLRALLLRDIAEGQAKLSEKDRKAWDATAREKKRIEQVGVTSDGSAIVARAVDGTLSVWDARTGVLRQEITSGENPVVAIRITGGKMAAALKKGGAQIWERTPDGRFRLVKNLSADFAVGDIDLSPDGSRVVGGNARGEIKVANVRTGKLDTFLGGGTGVYAARFLPDSTRVLVGYRNGLELWDARAGHRLYTFREFSGLIDAVVSRGGKWAAASFSEGGVQLYDLNLPPNPLILPVSAKAAWQGHFSPDGRHVAISSEDGQVTIWDVHTGRLEQTLRVGAQRVTPAVFSPDGTCLATGDTSGTALLWDVASGQRLRELKGHAGSVNGAVFAPNGKSLWTTSDDKTVIEWETATGRILKRLQGHVKEVEALDISPDGARLLTGGDDHNAILWDTRSGRRLKTFRTPGEIWAIAISPDGKWGATGDLTNAVEIWDLSAGRLLRALKGHRNWIVQIAFSPDGRRLVTASRDGTAKVWELETGRELLTLPGHTGQVSGVAWSPTEARIVTVGQDGTARVWSAVPLPAP